MKTGPRTEATRVILAFIRESQPVAHQVLLDKFRPQAAAVGMAASSWLRGRLANLRESGYIDHGPQGWTAAPEEQVQAIAPPHHRVRRKPAPAAQPAETSIAQPRRVSMFGPTYVPPVQEHRAGAMDYAQHPSLIGGRATAYRRGW